MSFKIVLILLFSAALPLIASQPVYVQYGRGRSSTINALMEAQTLGEKGDLSDARQKLDAIIKMDPTFYPAYYLRAQVLLAQRNYGAAVRDCNEALKRDSTFAEAAVLRARANEALGHSAMSMKELDYVIGIRPRQGALARAYAERARIHLESPDPGLHNDSQAIKDATMACKHFAWRDEDTIDLLAVAYASSGDFISALKYEQKALALPDLSAEDRKRLEEHASRFQRQVK